MTYNSKAEIEAKIAELQKLLADFRDEPDYEALRPAVQASYDAGSLGSVCDTPMGITDKQVARNLLAAYPHLKAYHEGLEPEWIEWGPDSEGYPNCPLPEGVEFLVRPRKGSAVPADNPELWDWTHLKYGSDITAYRIIGDTK